MVRKGKYVISFSHKSMKDFAFSLIGGRLWVGKYPTDGEISIIEGQGFTHIVNLCTKDEVTWEPYRVKSLITSIAYPFHDGSKQTPESEASSNYKLWTTFTDFLLELKEILSNRTNKVYIHCKGGHGRSPMIAAILYGILENKCPEEALEYIKASHQTRITMDPKWRRLGAPQRNRQKEIVRYYLTEILSTF